MKIYLYSILTVVLLAGCGANNDGEFESEKQIQNIGEGVQQVEQNNQGVVSKEGSSTSGSIPTGIDINN